MICSLDLSQHTKKFEKRKFVLSGSSNGPLYIWTQTTFVGRRWGREHRRIGTGVVREAREERARGGRSKKAGSGRNYAVEKGLKGVSQEKRVGAGNARKWRREFWTLPNLLTMYDNGHYWDLEG